MLLQCLIGNKYGPYMVPLSFQNDVFDEMIHIGEKLDVNVDLMKNWYEKIDNEYKIKDYR